MSRSETEVARLVREELDAISDCTIRSEIERLLVVPQRHKRGWEYGKEGENVECWEIAHFPGKRFGLAYSEQGHGPSFPWGVIELANRSYTGMDDKWYETLEEVYHACGGGESLAGYFDAK